MSNIGQNIDWDNMPEANRRKLAEARPDLARAFRETLEGVYRSSDERRAETKRIAAERKKMATLLGEPKISAPERAFLSAARLAVTFGRLANVEHQPEPFALDGKTTYRPDFWLTRGTQQIYVETKARWMHSENLTRMKLRQCSTRYPEHTWWLARWDKKLPWKVQVVVGGVIQRKAIVVEWLT